MEEEETVIRGYLEVIATASLLSFMRTFAVSTK